MDKKFIKNNSGFTLLEMMIAVSLFTVVMTISTNMFLQAIDSQARAISSKGIQESLNFSLIIMTNEMSGATVDPRSCDPENCLDSNEYFCVAENGGSLIFKNSNGDCVSYTRVMNANTGANILTISRGGVSGNLTPNNIDISDLNFSSFYTTDLTYPIARATIYLKGQSLSRENYPDTVSLQTTVAVGQQ